LERAVQKLDKIFAGLILVAMTLFWVIMSPAAITSRVSEAKPITLEQSATNVNAPLTRDQQRANSRNRRVDENIVRLKQRNRDTPRNVRKDVDEPSSDEVTMPKLGDIESDLDGAQGEPVFY